jgi:hypothetical protein
MVGQTKNGMLKKIEIRRELHEVDTLTRLWPLTRPASIQTQLGAQPIQRP